MPTLADLRQRAKHAATMRIAAAFTLDHPPAPPEQQDASALGIAAAQKVRQTTGLGNRPIDHRRLAELAGVSPKILAKAPQTQPLSFALDLGNDNHRVVLQGKINRNRRFSLARLLGDRLLCGTTPMRPATHAMTYRQTMQRYFASELLAPAAEVIQRTQGDCSREKIKAIANHFSVSPMAIHLILVDNGLTGRHNPRPADTA